MSKTHSEVRQILSTTFSTLKLNAKRSIKHIMLIVPFLGCASSWALTPGTPAPDFRLPQINGSAQIELKASQGKFALVYFFSQECDHVAKNFTQLSQLLETVTKDNLSVIAVSFDPDRSTAMKSVGTTDIGFPIVWDKTQSITEGYDLSGQPVAYLLNQQGQVQDMQPGCMLLDADSLEQTILNSQL